MNKELWEALNEELEKSIGSERYNELLEDKNQEKDNEDNES